MSTTNRSDSPDIFILPGRGNSGPDHWQTHWEAQDSRFFRLLHDEWETPSREAWVGKLVQALAARTTPVTLVAHSLSVSLVTHLPAAWAAAHPGKPLPVKAALLVAPSDVESPDYPPGPTGFAPIPRAPLPFPSIVVASTDDPRVTLDRARAFAQAWGSRLEIAGALGHIGSASLLESWPQGRSWLDELLLSAST